MADDWQHVDQPNVDQDEASKSQSTVYYGNALDWKFGQRSSTDELEKRGIIPSQYADVAHGNKSVEEANHEYQAYKNNSSQQVQKKLDQKLRPTPQDLEDRGIVPDWENPNILKENKQKNTESLKMKLGQRMDPNEADQRAIINKDELFSNKDYDEHQREKKLAAKELKLKMQSSLNQRADKSEIIFRGIVPQEYLDEDANVAKSKIKQQRTSIKQRMNNAFGNRPNPQEMNKLLPGYGNKEDNEDEIVEKMIKSQKGGKHSKKDSLDWKFGQRSSTKELEIRGIIPSQYVNVVHGDKSFEEAKNEWNAERRNSSKQIKKKLDLKLRPTRKDLKDRGIVPDWENPNILKENKQKNTKALKMKLGQRMDPNEADQRAIINKDELFSNKDYEVHQREKKLASKELKLKMQHSLTQRADKNDIIFRGIVPQEYLDEDVNVAKSKIKQQRSSIKQQMNNAFGNRPTPQEITNLLFGGSESSPIPQSFELSRSSISNNLILEFVVSSSTILPDLGRPTEEKIKRLQSTIDTLQEEKQNWQILEKKLKKENEEIQCVLEDERRKLEEERKILENEKTMEMNQNEKNNEKRHDMLENEELNQFKKENDKLKEEMLKMKENENKFKETIDVILNSKYELIKSTSSEIDSLRYRIKMYTKGHWNGVIANNREQQ